MRERVQARLAELKQEYVTGKAQLRELLQQEAALRETLLRISGAIQVLEEVLTERAESTANGGPAHDGTRASAGDAPEVLTAP